MNMLKDDTTVDESPMVHRDLITGIKIFRPSPFLDQLKEVKDSYLGFLFKLGQKNDVLTRRDFLFNRLKSKRSFISRLNNPLTKLGFIIIFIAITWAVFAPWISIYNYQLISDMDKTVAPFARPSWPAHPLGVTFFGRDIFGRLIWGARASLTMGLLSIVIATVFGVMIGVFSGYVGGWVDNLIMRIMDIIMAFPSLIMIIIILSIFPNPKSRLELILLLYGFLGIPGYARLIRGTVLSEKTRTYVEAAKVSGSSNFRIMFKHILPNCIAPIIVSVTFDIGGIILSLAGLSYLGFGDQNLVEWGGDIQNARSKLYDAPWSALIPGIGIFLSVLGFMLAGDGLRDALDPRLQKKMKK